MSAELKEKEVKQPQGVQEPAEVKGGAYDDEIKALKEELKELKKASKRVSAVEPVVGFSDVRVVEEDKYAGLSRNELIDLASKELAEEREDFERRASFTRDMRYSAHKDWATWEEIAVLRAYDKMSPQFKEKYGKTYENLRQGKYHEILKDEVEKVEKFRNIYKDITGEDLPDEPYYGFSNMKYKYSQVYLNF